RGNGGEVADTTGIMRPPPPAVKTGGAVRRTPERLLLFGCRRRFRLRLRGQVLDVAGVLGHEHDPCAVDDNAELDVAVFGLACFHAQTRGLVGHDPPPFQLGTSNPESTARAPRSRTGLPGLSPPGASPTRPACQRTLPAEYRFARTASESR